MLSDQTPNSEASQDDFSSAPDFCQYHHGEGGQGFYTTISGYDPQAQDLEFVIQRIDERLAGLAEAESNQDRTGALPVEDRTFRTLREHLLKGRDAAVRQLKEI